MRSATDPRPAAPARWKPWTRLLAVGVLVLALVAGSELALSRPASQPRSSDSEYTNLTGEVVGSTWAWPTGDVSRDPLALREAGYTLLLQLSTATLTVRSAAGSFSFPLTATVGRSALPPGTHFQATTDGASLSLYALGPGDALLERAQLAAQPHFFEVTFSSQLGGDPFAGATFFSNGHQGLGSAALHQAFSPDPVDPSLAPTPTTYLGVHRPFVSAPFAPPPLDLEFRDGAGWAGVGLVQVPDATALSLTDIGGVSVNYPLARLTRFSDQGAGGLIPPPLAMPGESGRGTWLGFPSFVVTVGSSPYQGLLAYHQALAQLGYAPVAAPPGHRPGWWTEPMVDTWGQQMVTGAARTSARFTANWVRNFVSSWRSQFGVRHFTLIIDSQWQARLGHATPSARFGGVAGMRSLIQQLHAQGIQVMLWWPLWINQTGPGLRLRVDPTASGFSQQIAGQMTELLGTGPNDLGANGLKLDWGYLVPPPTAEAVSRPRLGLGAALLLRYMKLLSSAAWRTDPAALIDASAVAPQFGGTEDTLRLYDAHLASTWSGRAAIVSAVDPLSLIDGDGWKLSGSQAVAHIVESSVFGVPAVYYSTRWSGGDPISRTLARALGAVVAVGEQRGQGAASPLANGEWQYVVRGRVTARTLADSHAVVVYHYSPAGFCRSATVISVVATQVTVPNCPGDTVNSIKGGLGRQPRLDRDGSTSSFAVRPGVSYLLWFVVRHRDRRPALALLGADRRSRSHRSPRIAGSSQAPLPAAPSPTP